MRTVLHDPLHAEELLLPEQQAAIGCVAVESARLENLITVLVWSILCLEVEPGRLLTDNFSTVSGKLQLLKDLMPLLVSEPRVAKEFHAIYEKITDILPRRNTVIHGVWEQSYSLADLSRGIMQPRKGLAMARRRARKSKSANIEMANDVMAIAHELHRCYRDLHDLTQRHSLLPPLPDKLA